MSESSAHAHQPPSGSEIAKWKKVVAEFEKPSAWRATWQLVSTLALYIAGWTAMFHVVKNPSLSLWLLIPLFLVTGGMLVRVFIIFHDCCHNSFFKSGLFQSWGDCNFFKDFDHVMYSSMSQ